MTIRKETYETILNNLQLGNSIAEHDSLLQEARVDTPVYRGVIEDKYDIVTGRKGAGKTAIFTILGLLRQSFLDHQHCVILTGVNSSGEPVFSQFKNSFKSFSEEDFENFWKIYFISLIYNDFLKNPEYTVPLAECGKEIAAFKKACHRAGMPNIPSRMERREIIEAVMMLFRNVKTVKGKLDGGTNTSLFSTGIEVEMKDQYVELPAKRTAVYVDDIGKTLQKVLEKCDLQIWIVLDRLDEVFERYSMVEFNGLRGLLKAYRSFDAAAANRLKVKLFMRDDIKLFLVDAKLFRKFFRRPMPPFPAATHVFSKESPVLTWTRDEIEKLILYRLLLSPELKKYVNMTATTKAEVEQELRLKEKRQEYWDKIFPKKIAISSSLDWIYSRLRDSNGVVTPRSVIDLLNGAVDFQKQNLQVNFEDSADIFPAHALKQGHVAASKAKLEKEIYNEFPKDQEHIKKLAGRKGKLTRQDLRKLYGDRWETIAEDLRQIGVLRLVKSSNNYMVELLYRPALDIYPR